MKQIRSLLILLCLVLLLSACGSGDIQTETWNWNEMVETGAVFAVEGLHGLSPEALAGRERMVSAIDAYVYGALHNAAAIDTPRYLFLRGAGDIPYAYDKSTGTLSLACRDETCTHGNCIWKRADFHIYPAGDLLLFYVEAEYTLYAGDWYGENLRRLYSNMGKMMCAFTRDGDDLYFTENTDQTEMTEIPADDSDTSAAGGTLQRLLRVKLDGSGGAEELLRAWGIELSGTGTYFLYKHRVDAYTLYDRKTKTSTELEDSIRPTAFVGDWLYYEVTSGEIGLWRLYLPDPEVREQVLEAENVRVAEQFFSGDTLYRTQTSVYAKGENKYTDYQQTQLFAYDLKTGEKTLIMEFRTDGIPDYVEDVCIDGNLLFVRSRTYLDFPNQYNPGGKRNDPVDMLIDLSTGRRLVLIKGE